METSLLELIDAALREIQPLAAKAFPPAASIERQLNWCRDFVCGLPCEPAPGPFSMGLIAVREFDMYGDMPELAALISKVQRLVEERLAQASEKRLT